MKTARQLMKKEAVFKAEMDKAMAVAMSDDLWEKAAERLQSILDHYGELPAAVQIHTNSIFPAAAIYLTVKEKYGAETAYRVIEDGAVSECNAMRPTVEKMMKLPGMPDLFVRIWDPLTKKMFGRASGFQNRFYPNQKGEYRMDILQCPYFRYLTELGCPELTRIYCENDERIYCNLPGIEFRREGTIGKGADHCDFYVRRVK